MMGAAFQPGQELAEDDLKILFTDNNGQPITTLDVRYSIYQYDACFCNTGNNPWISLNDQYHQTPMASATPGKYWAPWDIPFGQPPGAYQIRWDFREDQHHEWKQKSMNFAIVVYQTTSPVRTAECADLPDKPIVIVR